MSEHVELLTPKNVEIVDIDDLIPYPNNARQHTDEQVMQIAGSMKVHGFINPVIVDEDNMILAGHGRVKAAHKLERTDIPVTRVTHLSDAQKRAFILAANKIGDNSTFDYEMLTTEIARLKEDDFDLATLGFSEFELTTFDADVFGSDDFGGGEGGDDFGGGDFDGGEGGYSIQYTLVFDNEEQQKKWMAHLANLKAKYPECDTIAERVMAFIKEDE
jgi:hypothetical protein